MRRKNLSLQSALEKEHNNSITILSTQKDFELLNTQFPLYSSTWYDNYLHLLDELPEVDIPDLLDYIKAEYIIEIPLIATGKEEVTNTRSWIYLYGVENRRIKELTKKLSKARYVYILGRDSTPNLLKIGKALDPVARLKSVNSAGVLDEWRILYVLPVTDDYKVESLVHKSLKAYRRGSLQGSSREFFEVDLETAIESVEEVGRAFYAGEGVRYE